MSYDLKSNENDRPVGDKISNIDLPFANSESNIAIWTQYFQTVCKTQETYGFPIKNLQQCANCYVRNSVCKTY